MQENIVKELLPVSEIDSKKKKSNELQLQQE